MMDATTMNEDTGRVFAHDADAGDARWWLGGLAIIKATTAQTAGHYTLVEVHEPHGAENAAARASPRGRGLLDPGGRATPPARSARPPATSR
jgi:hypothetical protein